MQTLDWILLALPLLVIFTVGALVQRYMKSVADFMSCGRLAGRYLLTVARGEMAAGAVVFVALFEKISQAGFTISWWLWLQMPVFLLVAISGFVIYRYRETRALTLAQFFEIRYNRNFRLLSGVMGFLAGILNFGIIPAVGSRFMVYIFGFPAEVQIFHHWIPTYIPLMALLLSITLTITLAGGMITVMVTDCLEGIFSQLFYLIIIAALLIIFSWDQITQVIATRPAGHSLVNPFDSLEIKDFNLWFVLMTMFLGVYGTMAWQNASAYNAAALNPHESRMASVLSKWREMGKMAVATLLAICGLTFLNHPDFASQSAAAAQSLGSITDPQIKTQMLIPNAISHFLPMGIKGLFCAVLIMGIFGGDSTHLHSWGGIFVQDVLLPWRKTPLSPRQHILLLRLSICGVALFAFLFGIFFRQTEYIIMWWSVTMGIFVGGAGAAIIGGLYWKKGTTSGAFAGMISGATLAGGGIMARQFLPAFPLNGVQVSFTAALCAIAIYVIVSLITCREDFDMDRMLHRGRHALSPAPSPKSKVGRPKFVAWVEKAAGINGDFTRNDKWVAGLLFLWGLLWFAFVAIGSIWNSIEPWPATFWPAYWHIVGVGIPIAFAVITGIWFTWGGFRDLFQLFGRLAGEKSDARDDGTVRNHQNLTDITSDGPDLLPAKQNKSPTAAPPNE